jgi:hypothetical protein
MRVRTQVLDVARCGSQADKRAGRCRACDGSGWQVLYVSGQRYSGKCYECAMKAHAGEINHEVYRAAVGSDATLDWHRLYTGARRQVGWLYDNRWRLLKGDASLVNGASEWTLSDRDSVARSAAFRTEQEALGWASRCLEEKHL